MIRPQEEQEEAGGFVTPPGGGGGGDKRGHKPPNEAYDAPGAPAALDSHYYVDLAVAQYTYSIGKGEGNGTYLLQVRSSSPYLAPT